MFNVVKFGIVFLVRKIPRLQSIIYITSDSMFNVFIVSFASSPLRRNCILG